VSRFRSQAVAYFLAQGVAVAAWWTALVAMPEMRETFRIRGAPFSAFASFAPADIGIIAIGSILVAARGGRGWGLHAAWLVTGAFAYATCFVVAGTISGIMSAFAPALMVPAAVASALATIILTTNARADILSPGPSA
jgi:hypothetical protein